MSPIYLCGFLARFPSHVRVDLLCLPCHEENGKPQLFDQSFYMYIYVYIFVL